MGDSCILKPVVKNKKGEEVESKLFNDLLHYSSNNREFAKRYYFIGTDDRFLQAYQDKVNYDENGEITFRSLKNLTHLDIGNEALLKTLNKDAQAGEYDYDRAVVLMNQFNSDNPYNKEYMATITPSSGDRVALSVVRRNTENEMALEQVIANRALFDRIRNAIERLGGSVSFIDENYSKYDTTDVQRLTSGLYNIISLSDKGDITADIAEEAGHFAVGALGNNPLVQRLEELCTPEVQQSVLGDHYRDVKGRVNPRRETAGFLVGQYIKNEVDKESVLGRMAGRIWNLAKRMFYKIKQDDVRRMELEAKIAAKDIARGFFNGEGNIENALNTEEVLYSAEDSAPVSAFKDILQHLDLLATKMQAVDKTIYDKWRNIEAETAIGRLLQNPSWFADMMAIDGISSAITQLADSAPEMIELLDSVDFDPKKTPVEAKKLRQVRNYVTTVNAIMGIIDNLLSNESVAFNENTKKTIKDAQVSLSKLIKGDNKMETNLLKKERKMFLAFVEDIYGSAYVHRAARVLFSWKRGLHKEEASYYSIERALERLEEDDNFVQRYLMSMADSSDIVNQMIYKAKAAANRNADENTIRAWDSVRVLEKKIKDLKVNTNRLLEKSAKTGKLTGNYISAYNWGDWENDWVEFKNKCKEDFFKNTSVEGKTVIEKDFMWDTYFRPLMWNWHKAHSVYDKELQKYVPNDNYRNPEYNNLTPQEKSVLGDVLEIKGNLDDLLIYQSYRGDLVETAHTNLYRMPQFRGSTTNRIENLRMQSSLGKSVSKALRQNLINTFVINSQDTDYGSAATHNTLDEDVFSDALDFEKQKVSRVPLYGINKFKDMSELSTDICAGLVQYAAMASSYAASVGVVDILETGKEVLKHRRVQGLEEERTRDKQSKAYGRYLDFLDAQIYNLYASRKSWGKIAISKVVGFLSGLGSKLFLGGNVAGGVVNVGTGFIEITKEAVAGETYTLADLKKANAVYFAYLPANLLAAGEAVKDNKVSLFMRRFNVQNDLDTEVREYSTRESRWTRLNPFGKNLLLPYKSGDHYMQTMSYLAAANHCKFIDKDGKIISMWDALEVQDIDPDHPKAGKTLEFKEGVKYIDPETGEHRDWNLDDDVKFTSLCRETNNRMHGIYNKLDKTAFHNNLVGQALLAMRGYALGLFARRFSRSSYNAILGRESEGSMVTLFKTVLNMVQSKDDFIASLRAIVCPFGKNAKSAFLHSGFSEAQFANMRRNFMDFGIIAVLAILRALTAKTSDDDDDDDNIAMGITYYFASRLLNEQTAYNTPSGIWDESKGVLSWMPSGASALSQLYQMAELFITQEEYESSSTLYEKGDPKWERKVSSYLPYYRSMRIIEHPYEATEAYEYGRTTYR